MTIVLGAEERALLLAGLALVRLDVMRRVLTSPASIAQRSEYVARLDALRARLVIR